LRLFPFFSTPALFGAEAAVISVRFFFFFFVVFFLFFVCFLHRALVFVLFPFASSLRLIQPPSTVYIPACHSPRASIRGARSALLRFSLCVLSPLSAVSFVCFLWFELNILFVWSISLPPLPASRSLGCARLAACFAMPPISVALPPLARFVQSKDGTCECVKVVFDFLR
jgi:hypothetical protein